MVAKKYFWITDPHFDLISPKSDIIDFFIQIRNQNPDGIFLTGDISIGPKLINHLQQMVNIVNCPIYFVLGNHDFFHSGFQEVENSVINLTQKEPDLLYLKNSLPISLNAKVAVIGDNVLFDGLWRKPYTALVFIYDFLMISEFKLLSSNKKRLLLLETLAQQTANRLKTKLLTALETHSTVYVLAHVPPWPDTRNWLINMFWTPYNSCKIVAEMLSGVMKDYPDKELIVLAGHCHDKRITKIAENIELRVGAAKYNYSEIQETILI